MKKIPVEKILDKQHSIFILKKFAIILREIKVITKISAAFSILHAPFSISISAWTEKKISNEKECENDQVLVSKWSHVKTWNFDWC